MRTLVSFAALFLSVALLQLSSGGLGPLDALTGLAGGFSRSEVGLLGSAHFVGFFLGCWMAPRLMGAVGHARSFATFTALGVIGLIAHTLLFSPYAWAVLRIASGLCVAGAYTVIEAWLQARVTNETRGRTMGLYRVVDMGAAMTAQLMIGALADVETYVAYNILALLGCCALFPLMVTRSNQPEMPRAPRLRPALAYARSPLAVTGVLAAAVTSASFRMVGPVYGQEVGLSADQIGIFLAAWVGGGALAQFPAGWLADRYDRRWVLIWLSIASVGACAITVAATGSGTGAILLTSALFGATSFPIYSVAASHAHDFATSDERVELSAALMFWFAVGAIAAPLLTSALISAFGPSALFGFISLAHILLVIFGLARIRSRAAPERRTAYVWAPRTTFTVGRLFSRDRDRQPPGSDSD
ncbi:MFS transporter [Roseisalinus antarcticus]|uniref:Putative MFS-type transporter YcaD n=1 Tax=Roseisalinus antarcticus TaxID=254357 RepID=A0A1Y5S2B6_9RHOB|nr:MFS transporter [Roseisalinus antarcticus]SLN28365.1 putative MFS-type transporter YcaD [Roseisalinus antarcticus]